MDGSIPGKWTSGIIFFAESNVEVRNIYILHLDLEKLGTQSFQNIVAHLHVREVSS